MPPSPPGAFPWLVEARQRLQAPRGSPDSATHQDVRGSEEVAEGVVEEVDEGGRVEVGVAHHLAGKQRLPGAAAEQAAHHPVAHVHVVGHFLRAKGRLDPGRARGSAAPRQHRGLGAR